MPAAYLKVKRRLLAKGKGMDEAQEGAAKIYNAKHPNAPISGKEYDKKVARRKKR